jgi:D-glycero-alpha-D-manno-heptose-7-phosphate kinase
MIISRTPVRIPLGGGGTDLPVYYEKYGASLLSAGVDRYVHVLVKRRFEHNIRVSYSRTEIVDSLDEIQHPVVRETLRLLKIDGGIEIVSVADVPANVGLGTSSSFTVGLLNALHAYKGEYPSPRALAEEAFTVERIILGEAGGLQDQYIAAYGGLICIEVSTGGDVSITPLKIEHRLVTELESRLLFFNTNLKRQASEIQAEHVRAISHGEENVIQSLHMIKQIGLETKHALEAGDLDRFGKLLDEHWNYKKGVGSNMSNSSIDLWYNMAIDAGALGGKLIRAGGGGFLMFHCDQQDRDRVRRVLSDEGLGEIRFRFESTGSRILLNL